MSTSGTFSFTVNRDQIIREAMLNIGKLDGDETPIASEVSDVALKLNMLVKQWMGKTDFAPGLKVFTRRRGYLFLNYNTGKYSVGPTALGWTTSPVIGSLSASALNGANSVLVNSAVGLTLGDNIGIQLDSGVLQWTTISLIVSTTITLATTLAGSAGAGNSVFTYTSSGTQPLVVETALLRDNQNNDTPLKILQVQDYDMLPSKTDQTNKSDPAAIYYEFQLGNSNLFTDVGAAQDVSKYMVLTYLETIQDLNQASDNFEYPQEWFLAIAWGLSKQIAPMFKANWTPVMESNYGTALRIAGSKNPEVVTIFYQPGAED